VATAAALRTAARTGGIFLGYVCGGLLTLNISSPLTEEYGGSVLLRTGADK
jgi:hypothetical protein